MVALTGNQFALAADEDESIEEVIVTGSYLKRSAQDSPSPLSVITSADIEDIGAADVSEIIASMPWNSGSQSRAATFQGEGADGRNNVNLRNLGHGATLPLVNGKRHVPSWYNPRGNASTNVNNLVPTIAIQRVEIVKDGASATYGSDAVAGVVNFLTKSDFEGFDFTYQWTTDDNTGEGDTGQLSAIWGVQGDRGGVVVSAQVLDRNEINISDDYGRFGGSTLSSTGQPGRLLQIAGNEPVWAANGLFPGELVGANGENGGAANSLPRDANGLSYGQADVNCEDAAEFGAGFGGSIGNVFNRCVYDYGSFFSIQAQEKLQNFFVEGYYDISDNLTASFEFASNNSKFDRLNSLNPNAPALTIPTGTDYIDANGDIQTALNPGSQEDAFRRGIEPIPYANLTRLQGYSSRENGSLIRPIKTFTDTARSDQRMVFGLEWDTEINGKEWMVDFNYTASNHNSQTSQVQDTLSSHMELALNGYGGPECDPINGVPGDGNAAYAASGGDFGAGNCYFFNPFGSSVWDRDGNANPGYDRTLQNAPELYSWLIGRASSDTDYRQRVMEIVASGDLWDTASGPIAMAIGFQRRVDNGKVVLDSSLNTNNLDFVYGAQDWSGKLTTTAFFVEIGVPLGDMVELNAAARYEDFDELGEDTVDPKVTLIFRPTDSLTIRASAGSSFRAPSLQQSFGAITTVSNLADIVGGTTYKASITQGNPNLAPETADNVNFGLSWVPVDGPLEGLSIDVDYYQYEYEDIITRENSSTLLAADNAIIQAYADDNGVSLANAALNSARNYAQVVRNASGILLRLTPDFANADSAEIDGLDLTASYRFDNDWGNWRVGVQAAWAMTYDVDVGGTTFDGIGSYNFTNPLARPLPEFKINGTVSWSKDNHRVFAIARWIDEVEEDIPAGTAGFFKTVTAAAGNASTANDMADGKIEDMLTVDVQYNYSLGETGFLSDSNVSLGIQNIFDEEPPVVSYITGYDPRLHDARGRLFFVRVSGSM